MKAIFVTLLFLVSLVHADLPSSGKLKALYNSLDPTSVAQHLSFYDLYPTSPEGVQALDDAYRMLSNNATIRTSDFSLPSSLAVSLDAIIGLVNKPRGDTYLELTENELNAIETLAARLPNRKLSGHQAASEAEVLQLPIDQIDLARSVLLSQMGNSPEALKRIQSYEAAIDLMALQILTRVKLTATPKEKIRAINRFIFEEMSFRFPPHSTYAKDVDLYTFLPSVLDSQRGVCLGVSILYICLAQRLNLDLEIITPPGHIYVRWHQNDVTINIETTARGINLPDKKYLGIDTRKLQERNIRETIGMAHYNQASTFLERQDYDKTMSAYQKAHEYMGDDVNLLRLMGCTAILQGNEALGKKLFLQIADALPDFEVSKDTLVEDYLNGDATAEGIAAVFMHVDEKRESVIEKRKALEKALEKSPRFREGLFSLSTTWLQLHRSGEALKTLQRCHAIDPNQATVEYYLAVLYADRLDYNNSWKHLRLAESIVNKRQHNPEALMELRQRLTGHCPE